MCLTCGCMMPYDKHGNPKYLTMKELEESAKLDNLSVDKAMENLAKTVEIAKRSKKE